jgi:hypothetical protein
MAGLTRLELAASCVTGRRSNQTELQPRTYDIYSNPNFPLIRALPDPRRDVPTKRNYNPAHMRYLCNTDSAKTVPDRCRHFGPVLSNVKDHSQSIVGSFWTLRTEATAFKSGGQYWARTSDPLRVRQVLSPSELTAPNPGQPPCRINDCRVYFSLPSFSLRPPQIIPSGNNTQ